MGKVITPNSFKFGRSTKNQRANALSIDVEEHFHVHVFSPWIKREDWPRQTSRVVNNTQRLLKLLRRYDVQATFFILGWVAERHPALIKEIADDGHEIASHGYSHELVYEQTPDEFAQDLQRSLDAICQSVPDATITGYRAPSFSITKETPWAQDVLVDNGFQYDSSIFPVAMHDRYGIPDASRFAHRHCSGLWEFPMSTARIAGRNLPVAGGGYFRLYPLWLTQRGMELIHHEGQPAILYLHPWEVDPEQPRVQQATRRARFRHHVNIRKVETRLEKLLQRYPFAPVSQVFADELALSATESNAESSSENRADHHSAKSDLENPNSDHAYCNHNSRGTLLSPSGPGHAMP